MSDTPPPKGTPYPCGGTFGAWVKGTHPTNVGDIVKRNRVIQIAMMIIGLTITFERPFSSKTAEVILSTT